MTDDNMPEAYTSFRSRNDFGSTTLILGHGRKYSEDPINGCRCSPIDVKEWLYDPYVCVDNIRDIEPDIVYDLVRSIDYGTKYTWGDEPYMNLSAKPRCKWTFAEDETYERVIDCVGANLQISTRDHGTHPDKYKYGQDILQEICRVLKPHGIFYGNDRKQYVYQKINGRMILLS